MPKCVQCGKDFPTPQGLAGHKRWVHEGKRPKGGQAYLERKGIGIRWMTACPSCGSAFGLVGWDAPKPGQTAEASCPFCYSVFILTKKG